MAKIPFCNGYLDVGEYISKEKDFRVMVAQIEVLGTAYLDALQKQDIYIDKNGQMRDLLKERAAHGILKKRKHNG